MNKRIFYSIYVSVQCIKCGSKDLFDCSFQGSIMVDGHELHEEDLRLMYAFNQSSDSTAQYEAHSDAQVSYGKRFTP